MNNEERSALLRAADAELRGVPVDPPSEADLVSAASRRTRRLRGYDARGVSSRVALDTGTESATQQHLKDDTDINVLMRRFGLTGQAPRMMDREAFYGDFTGVTDLESAQALVDRTERAFMQLDPEVRERFDNSKTKFADFAASVSDEVLEEATRPRVPGSGPALPPAGPPGVVVPVTPAGGVPGGEAKP